MQPVLDRIDSSRVLHAEAVSLAGRARRYFDADGVRDRERLEQDLRVRFSVRRLTITTRLLFVFGSLTGRPPVDGGTSSIRDRDRSGEDGSGELATATDDQEGLPEALQELLCESGELERRACERLRRSPVNPVRLLRQRLEGEIDAPRPARDPR